MKSLALAMFARNWMRPVNPARGRLISAMVVAVMCAASLVAPAAADADIPCRQWRFDGYTQFDFADGGKLRFIWFDTFITPPGIEVWSIPPNGGKATESKIYGVIQEGGEIWMQRSTPQSNQWFSGGVTDDGFAYGIAWNDRDRSSSWRSADPLRCADNGRPPTQCPDGSIVPADQICLPVLDGPSVIQCPDGSTVPADQICPPVLPILPSSRHWRTRGGHLVAEAAGRYSGEVA